MARGGHHVLRLSPEPWLGVITDFSDKFRDEMKKIVDVRAWDNGTNTWWMPKGFLNIIVPLMRQHGVATDAEISRAMVEIGLAGPSANKARTLVEEYAQLALHPSAPPLLVEWALYFWRRELNSVSQPTTRLLHIEESYRRIQEAAAGGNKVVG